MLKAAVIQQHFTADRAANMASCADLIGRAAAEGAKLIVLSELHNSLYFCQSESVDFFDLAETIPGESTEFFGAIAKRLGVVLVLSLFERRAAGLYHNTAVVIEADGAIAGKYRKMHIPDDPAFYEKFYFTQGDLGFAPIATSVGKLGVLICWDQWYPEAARLMALAGADMLIYPTAIGWDPRDTDEEKARQLGAWRTIQLSHAVANALPVLSVNRVGFEADSAGVGSGILFWGNSFVAGAQGEVLASAPIHTDEAIITAEIDLSCTDRIRRIWPFLRDRRIDFYGDILKRWI
ncbi:apolipoprotein acyltransferase [Campylobacterota bacterium]|nr:apolipoprotein acyltransferase [Campylobacterota bacterium]